MTRLFTIQLLAFALLLSGCKLTPDYERPDLGAPETWRAGAVEGESIANLPWWEIYDDGTLTSLIERALEQNQDLAIAMARMQEADYLVTFTRAEQFPFLDVFGSAGRGRSSRKAVPGASTTNNFSLGANLSFEIDLWRRFARATEAARADLLSTEAAYRTVTIGLVARVARDYLLLRDPDGGGPPQPARDRPGALREGHRSPDRRQPGGGPARHRGGVDRAVPAPGRPDRALAPSPPRELPRTDPARRAIRVRHLADRARRPSLRPPQAAPGRRRSRATPDG